jgi:hypothetical protein
MNKVLAVVCCLPAVLFGFIGSFLLLSGLASPDHAGELRYLLFGVFLVSGSIICFWGAWRLWRSDKK